MMKTKTPVKKGLLLIAHGSRVELANREFVDLCKRVGRKLKGVTVQHAFLDCAQPDIPNGLEQLAKRGIGEITVIPHFLSRGKHTSLDIKNLVENFARIHPQLVCRITEPVGVLPEMVELIAGVYRGQKN